MLNHKQKILALLSASVLVVTCTISKNAFKRNADGTIIVNTNPSAAPLLPEESIKMMHLQKGYHLQLVAAEPMIHEPVAIAWDGNGRMFVAEMNTYMQDVDGSDEMRPVCSIKRLEDTDHDGKMDKGVIFIDSLILPRLILPLDDRLLVSETNSNNIYSYRDTNGDGKADEKKQVFRNDNISKSNLEHQKSGLIWNIDNRMYVTYDNVRYGYDQGMLKTEPMIDGSGGQWGLANDNYGRLFYSAAGAETPALDFQQNPYFGRLDIKGQIDDEFQAVWPVISTPDVQGGPRRLRPDSTLNHFTACAGQSIFRGTALPADAVGDLFIPEPVGRLIRRAKIINTNGLLNLKNAYNHEEFIASADMNFRPVNSATGPDGCMYIVDMYHGIIQESNWTKDGTYLRKEIKKRGFDKNVGRGRIYRLVYDGIKPDKTVPNLLNLPLTGLVKYLSHPNAWWRETAQKLMVVRGDKSVVPALNDVLLKSTDQLARIHALWTLDGLKALDKKVLLTVFNDKDAKVRQAAVWASEERIRKGDEQLVTALETLINDPNADVRYQVLLSVRYSKSPKAASIVKDLLKRYPDSRVMAESQTKFVKDREAKEKAAIAAKLLAEADQKLVAQGALIFGQLCATCHGPDGKGMITSGKDMPAPVLASNPDVTGDPDKLIRILLNGLSGPIKGKVYADVMPALGANDDNYIASVLSYIRNGMGNKAPTIKAADVKKVRQEVAGRTTNWTWTELDALKK